MTLAHLYASRVAVKRMRGSSEDGSASFAWVVVGALQSVPCRLDVGYLRPGKDQPMPIEAGKAPSRIALLTADSYCGIRAGDRITCVPGPDGKTPVTGTWELRLPPDEILAFSQPHHIEVQVIEVAVAVASGERSFPGGQ